MDQLGGISQYKMDQTMDQYKYDKMLLDMSRTKKDNPEKIKTAAKEMETYFLYFLMREMRKTVPESTLLPKSHGEKIFEEMQDQNYARAMAERGGIGLSKMLLEHLH